MRAVKSAKAHPERAVPLSACRHYRQSTPCEAQAPPSGIEAIVADASSKAEQFVTRYYNAQDVAPAERPAQLPTLYAPTARVTWNGNPISVADLAAFVQQMPQSKHDVQAFDCHPISGSAAGGPASLVVTVSGQVSHGSNPTPIAGTITSKNYDNLPRVFSQSFILVFTETGDPNVGVGGYQIAADSFRFC
ncbi:uncharacterized protein JCM15063_003087 [Sporobolomyces koalae]|uniref:uncharacterized protein n=1 Tax=Sporobolomyces koalae TaxID=500713 RepID=UPI00316F41C3